MLKAVLTVVVAMVVLSGGLIEAQQQAGRLSYLDQREYDGLEDMILELEEKEQELLKEMDDPAHASTPELLQQSWQDLEEVRKKIEQLYTRWDELETKKNRGAPS